MVTGITYHAVKFSTNLCLLKAIEKTMHHWQSCQEQIISDGEIMFVSGHLVL